jgi:hypothetical protein
MPWRILPRERALFEKGKRVIHPMPDFAIFETVDQMKVPNEQQLNAVLGIYSASNALAFRGNGKGVDDNLDAFRRIARYGEQLLEQLDSLNAAGRFYLKIRDKEDRISFAAYQRTTRRIVENATLLSKRKRPRRKPTGFTSQELAFLVWELEEIAQRFGGSLTLGKNSEGRPTGSLPAIVEIFRKYFPSLPAQVSYQTWSRLRRYAQDQMRRHKRHYGTPTTTVSHVSRTRLRKHLKELAADIMRRA